MIYEKLQKVQKEMKAPKDLYNSFGKYKYRNAESILEAFKPYGSKYGLVLILNDDIKMIGERVYIMATAKLVDVETQEETEAHAFARESLTKKGMDDSQITGATSSYARKYALNGLFLLDDTKDADSDEYKNESDNRQKNKPIEADPEKTMVNKLHINEFQKMCRQKGVDINGLIKRVGKPLEKWDMATYMKYHAMMEKVPNRQQDNTDLGL